MTALTRKRDLARSLDSQVAAFRRQGRVAWQVSRLLQEYVDRAHGFAELSTVPHDQFAESDHYALIVIGSRTLLQECGGIPGGESSLRNLAAFRAALCDALLIPDAPTLNVLRQRTESLTEELSALPRY